MALFKVDYLTPDEVDNNVIDVNDLPGGAIEQESNDSPVAEDKVETPVKEEKKEPEKSVKEILDQRPTPKVELLSEDEVEDTTSEPTEKPTKKSKKDVEQALDYKELAQYKIDSGQWEAWDDWDEIKDSVEWTPEFFAEREKEQFEYKVQKAIEEEKSSLPDRVKEITEHIKNGGKEEDLFDFYRQEIDIESTDETNPDQAAEIIRASCEAMEWSKKRTDTYLNSLKDAGEDELLEAAKEAKQQLLDALNEQKQEVILSQKKQQEQYKNYIEGFNKKVREAIYKDELPDREKKELEKFVFDYKHTDESSKMKYSEFGKKFREIQNDPEKYYKFLRFIKDFDNFEDAKKVEKKTAFNFMKKIQENKPMISKDTAFPSLISKGKQKGQFNPFSKES